MTRFQPEGAIRVRWKVIRPVGIFLMAKVVDAKVKPAVIRMTCPKESPKSRPEIGDLSLVQRRAYQTG